MSSIGENQPDPDCSPSGQAVEPVLDDPGEVWSDARHLTDPGSQSLELFEVGDVRCVDGLTGLYRQEQAGKGILRGRGAGLKHGLISRLDQGCGTSDSAKDLGIVFYSGCIDRLRKRLSRSSRKLRPFMQAMASIICSSTP
jgi:hypothetical protein